MYYLCIVQLVERNQYNTDFSSKVLKWPENCPYPYLHFCVQYMFWKMLSNYLLRTLNLNVSWNFICVNLRPPLIFLVPVSVEKWSKWRHTLKNTTRVEIIITNNAENCTIIRAWFFLSVYVNYSTNCYCTNNICILGYYYIVIFLKFCVFSYFTKECLCW